MIVMQGSSSNARPKHENLSKAPFTHAIFDAISMRFSCDVVYKTCPSLPCTFFLSRNTERKYRQVSRNSKEGCLQIICDNFLSNLRDALRNIHLSRVGSGPFCTRNHI